jgi:hypothetical protein
MEHALLDTWASHLAATVRNDIKLMAVLGVEGV